MLNCIYGVEILNEKYNPFELKLTGWSEQINADITNYYDVFGEIYEKYNKPGKSMSPELKLILMLGGSALKFHLNNVAMSGRIGLPGMPQMNNRLGGNSGPMGSQENVPGQDPKIIEQMRQQAMVDRIREETRKQAENLQRKSEEQHEQAAKQMQDMMLLQKEQSKFTQQEALKRQKLEEFERVKALMEQQNQIQQPQPRPTAPSNQYSPMSNLQQFNGPPVQAFTVQRRDEIDRQLQNMKNNLNNLNQQNQGRVPLSQDMRELNAEKLYARNPNVKNNIKTRNSGITVDTSSEQSSAKTESSSSSSSKKSSSTSSSSSSSESNAKSKSQGSSKKNLIDRSLSSRNNQSSLSKRKYKKQLTFDTS